MFVYKYLREKYLEQFRERGTIAIGNIEWYRDIENKRIQDPLEGRTKYLIHAGREPIELSIEQVNAITNDYHISARLRIAPYTFFEDYLNVPNAFVFSMSYRFDRDLMKRFGCDACYKIADIKQFANIIQKELNKQYRLLFSVAKKVSYVETKEIYVTNNNKNTVIRTTSYNKSKSERIKTIYIEDYFAKPDVFKEEKEFRFIFVPEKPIGKKPVYLHCTELINYCDFEIAC
jgi:uncharacterized ferritin-like protein (DUF455 family)